MEPTLESIQSAIDLVGKELMPYLFQLQTADLLSHAENFCQF